MPQVITISPGGAVSGLQVKPGKGLDLTKLGRAEVKRASEIVWDEVAQAWKIDVLQDAGKGELTFIKLANAAYEGGLTYTKMLLDTTAPSGWFTRGGEPLRFYSYDEAVQIEIAYLDALRLKGKF